ncbi:ermin isoform X2 [Anolis carolinensis]|uniref:ermin isoform X2 n=1 Tax=Anolis carolinensis TaxID=28377 RepID=UPI000462D85F|nr:PREDICTED: ermin isoform X2 [Anolis carolinensis]|eukprot:XP_008114775.1 PREDICTED: ermin isoform X2 [Anolis carolinensis]
MTDIMTEDVQVPTSMSEYNGNVSPEKPQLQVIDIIDQIANSVEIFPYDSAASQPALLLTQESQGGVGHLVENSVYEACDISTYEDTIGMKEHQELCQESHPTSSREQDIPEEEEWDAELCQGENIDDMAEEEQEEKKEAQLSESTEKIKEGEQSKASEKTAVKDAVGTGGGGVLKTNNEDSHKKGQENNSKEFRPIHPSCNAQTEKPDELTGTLRKNDISRHSYSRYNTISYRKIRKGNTKQRIDEFESMMHS